MIVLLLIEKLVTTSKSLISNYCSFWILLLKYVGIESYNRKLRINNQLVSCHLN